MPLSPETLAEKPYNLCLNCVRIGTLCDGPNFLAMPVERWCEWCRLRKQILGLTNTEIADRAVLSLTSVRRALAGDVKDLRISTMQAITRVLVNGTWGQYPCPLAADASDALPEIPALIARAEAAEQERDQLQATLDALSSGHKGDLDALRAEDQRKIDHLIAELSDEKTLRIADRERHEVLQDQSYDYLKRKDRYIVFACSMLALSMLLNVLLAALL